jgi:hypothetical protein
MQSYHAHFSIGTITGLGAKVIGVPNVTRTLGFCVAFFLDGVDVDSAKVEPAR